MSQIQVRHSYRMNENCVYLAYPWKKAWWHEAAKSFLIVDVILDLLISQKNYVTNIKFQEILFLICRKICSAQPQNWVNYARKNQNKTKDFKTQRQISCNPKKSLKKVVSRTWNRILTVLISVTEIVFVLQGCRKTNQGDNPIHLQEGLMLHS